MFRTIPELQRAVITFMSDRKSDWTAAHCENSAPKHSVVWAHVIIPLGSGNVGRNANQPRTYF